MPKSRKRGYTYAKRRDGSRYRVYSGSRKRSTRRSTKKTSKRRSTRRKSSNGSAAMDGVVYGYGKYHARGTSLNRGTQIPKMENSRGGFCVKHKEFLGDILGSEVFRTVSHFLNPGNKTMFPWLSQIAENFEQWRPKGIMLMYKAMSTPLAGSAANPSLGTVMMTTDYNVYNGEFGNKIQMESYEGCVSIVPYKSVKHMVECSNRLNPMGIYYVRSGTVPPGGDQRLYDLGRFQLAVSGMQSANHTIGELWISYDIELLKPRLVPGDPLANEPAVDHFSMGSGGYWGTGKPTDLSSITPQRPFGTNTTNLMNPSGGSTLGGKLSGGIVAIADQPDEFEIPILENGNPTGALQNSLANTYYFPQGLSRGTYMISYMAVWGTTGAVGAWTAAGVNCTNAGLLNVHDTALIYNQAATTSTTSLMNLIVDVQKPYAYIVFGNEGGAQANPTWCDIMVSALPIGLDNP